MSTSVNHPLASTDSQALLATRFQQVRQLSDVIRRPLTAEDCMVQSMPDVSPTRWHLAHTTWFFEQFVLGKQGDYQTFDESFNYLFNSYYNQVGEQFPRFQRGVISRPGLDQVLRYRAYVDEQMLKLLGNESLSPEDLAIIEIGMNHEQQHQELMLTDIKHVLSCNPLFPVYRPGRIENASRPGVSWISYSGGMYSIGHRASGFAYDNEGPPHQVYSQPFSLSSQLVTCGEYMEFMDAGGYQRPEFWLSMGWTAVQELQWQAPLYWLKRDASWQMFTLAGLVKVDPEQPVSHISYFEADAFARWRGARLPTEVEWEIAASQQAVAGNFSESLSRSTHVVHPTSAALDEGPLRQVYGDVWEWTASQYMPYPGYTPPAGAIGEYNGKFMCNQFVLRGGSCATPHSHIRPTYRNFFPPDARWQFSGIRLAGA